MNQLFEGLRYWRDCWREDLRYLGWRRFLWQLPAMLLRDVPCVLALPFRIAWRGAHWWAFRHMVKARDGWRCAECGANERPLACRWPEELPLHLRGVKRLEYWLSLCPSCNARRNMRDAARFHRDREAWRKLVDELFSESETPPAP